jgi:hypothetical protein
VSALGDAALLLSSGDGLLGSGSAANHYIFSIIH